MRKETILSGAAIVLSLGAGALWLLHGLGTGEEPAQASSLDGLEQRIESLRGSPEEARLLADSLQGQMPLLSAPVERTPDGPSNEGANEIADRLHALEESLAQLDREFHEWMTMSAEEREKEREAEQRSYREVMQARTQFTVDAMLDLQKSFLDDSVPMPNRLSVLRELKRFPAGMHALDPVIDELSQLLLSEEAGSQERIVDQADGIDDSRITEALLELLAKSSDDGVRLEIVRALDDSIHLPHIRSAIEEVARGRQGEAQEAAARAIRKADSDSE